MFNNYLVSVTFALCDMTDILCCITPDETEKR